MCGQCPQGGNDVEFVFACREERVDNLHGNLNFNFGFLGSSILGIVLLASATRFSFLSVTWISRVATTLGHAYVVLFALDSDIFAVFGGANGVQKGAKINIFHVRGVDMDFAVVQMVLVNGRKNFFGEFDGHIDANGFSAIVLAFYANVDPLIFRCGVESFERGVEGGRG